MKPLRLSKKNKKIAGVCGAFAASFDIDATLVRIAWACCTIFAGTGLLAYVLCWLVIPNEE
ncbi:MAG: PspC domain-containing protein [Fibromonadales bacterium]|nr:PspC domain-containing protein [Fibromonadales bacterium]